MRYIIACFLFLMACSKVQIESTTNFDCINEMADKSLSIKKVNDLLPGTWVLKRLATMLPSTEVPDIELVISKDNSGVFDAQIFEEGKLVVKTKFELQESAISDISYVKSKIISTSFNTETASNFLDADIRICENELLLDNGMAFDAPGWFFARK